MVSINQMSLNTKYSRRGLTFNGATPQLPAKADRALKVESEHKPTKAVAEGKEKNLQDRNFFKLIFIFVFPKLVQVGQLYLRVCAIQSKFDESVFLVSQLQTNLT